MIANNKDVINVVKTNFLTIFGLVGAPGSVPSIIFPFSCCEFIFRGKIINKTSHHKIIKTTTDPVMDIINELNLY